MNSWSYIRNGRERRGGQTLLFMVLALVVLALVLLWVFDVHKTLYVKHVTRNAGDAAALAAARWQGITLNLIGELNVMQAVAISEGLARGDTKFPDAEVLADLQARLCFVGPIMGLATAQQAAKNNGLYVNEQFTDDLSDHALKVKSTYAQNYAEPYRNNPSPPTSWDDYAGMLAAVADEGVAVYPENAKYYGDFEDDGHLLLNPSFYDAVASADWCWFHWNAMGFLQSYTSWLSWPPLTPIHNPRPVNSEFYGLHLRRIPLLTMLPIPPPADAHDLVRQMREHTAKPIDLEVVEVATTWYGYQPGAWASWNSKLPDDFPFLSDIQDRHDYAGADAATLIDTRADLLTPGAESKSVTWTAAAKPFGYLDSQDPPSHYGLVLPAFRETGLIPVDASSAPGGGSRPGWGTHIRNHLEPYLQQGLPGLAHGCWYCDALRLWENAAFRQAGLAWLAKNSSSCIKPTGPGGGGGGGGTRRGH
jgi:hypothetical protein